MTAEMRRRYRRRSRQRAGFRVVPKGDAREQKFMVVAPTGVALYSFTDVHAAAAEAAELNAVKTW